MLLLYSLGDKMKVRMKSQPALVFYSGKFSVHGIGEVQGCHESFGVDLFFIRDLDVFIEATYNHHQACIRIGWKDMGQAFEDHDLITDSYNTHFFEPGNKEDRKRGFILL